MSNQAKRMRTLKLKLSWEEVIGKDRQRGRERSKCEWEGGERWALVNSQGEWHNHNQRHQNVKICSHLYSRDWLLYRTYYVSMRQWARDCNWRMRKMIYFKSNRMFNVFKHQNCLNDSASIFAAPNECDRA